MNTYLLDTNVVSYFIKGNNLASVYGALVKGTRLAISFMTVAELYEGAYRAGWGSAKFQRLEAELNRYVLIGSSPVQCRIWAEVRSWRKNQPIAVDDAWIAASALEMSIPLVTNNRADFDNIPGLSIISASP